MNGAKDSPSPEEASRLARVAIIGVGSLACLFGAKLARHLPVTLIGSWAEQVEALRRSGLTLIEPDGGGPAQGRLQRRLQPLTPVPQQITSQAPSLAVLEPGRAAQAMPPAQLVLVLVKSRATASAVQTAKRYLDPEVGVALTLQNGLGNLEQLQAAVGVERAALGVTTQGAHIVEPGVVRHAGEGPTHVAGPPGLERRLRQVAELFSQAGLPTTWVPSVDGLLWGKLTVNAAINPLAALLRRPNGALLQSASGERLLRRAAQEVVEVAQAAGIELPFDGVERALEVCRATAANRGSMLQDLAAGRPTEVDVISGAVARKAAELGGRAPLNALLTRLVDAAQRGVSVAEAQWRDALLDVDEAHWKEDLRWLRRQLPAQAG